MDTEYEEAFLGWGDDSLPAALPYGTITKTRLAARKAVRDLGLNYSKSPFFCAHNHSSPSGVAATPAVVN